MLGTIPGQLQSVQVPAPCIITTYPQLLSAPICYVIIQNPLHSYVHDWFLKCKE